MRMDIRTATATVALIIGAGAYPFAATAQTETESQEVEVEVIETEEAGEEIEQALDEAGEETGQALGEAGQAIEQGAEETGQALGEGAQEVEQAAEEVEVEVETAGTGDLDDSQIQELEQAAAEGKPVPPAEMMIGVQREDQWLSSDLTDREVQNQAGEDIGDIGAILFSEDGPAAVIVEVGGFLGIGEKEVAIKWDEISITDEAIVVNATEEALENAPEFVSLGEQGAEAEQTAQQTEALPPAGEEPVTVDVETTQ